MSKLSPQTAAHKWMLQGIEENVKTRDAFERTKAHALTAGFYFLKARESWGGEFQELVDLYAEKIGKTTIYRYMSFTEEALAWVVRANPKLQHDVEAQLKVAFQITLESPKPMVALLRALKKSNASGDPYTDFQMLPFGLYDAVADKTRRIAAAQGGDQLELGFDAVLLTIAQISRLGQPNFHLVLPEGKTEIEALDEFESNLQAALDSVHAARQKLSPSPATRHSSPS